jgi:hypothetical protein
MKLRLSPRLQVICVLALLVFTGVSTRAQSVQDGYKAPSITIPYAWTKPTLDGVIRDAEWQGAVSLDALQTTSKAVSARQTRFWLEWDEDNLYVAMRSPLRPGERPLQALRDLTHDVNAVFDDSYEIWLDIGSHSADGQPVFFQYLGNFAGARWDSMQEPAVGNSRLSWTAGWKPHNRLTLDGRFWEMEMAIPRRSLYQETPFRDGFAFTGLLTRNFKRPWEQVSLAGSGSFSVRETYARYLLSKSAPGVHLIAVGDPTTRGFGLSLAASGQKAQTLRWRFDSDGGVHKAGELPIRAGQTTTLPPMLDLDRPGAGGFRIQVLPEDGTTPLLDWSAPRAWGDFQALSETLHDTGDQVDLTIVFNPVRDYLRVTGDFINYDARRRIAACRVVARDAGKRLIASQSVRLDSLDYARSVLTLPHLSPGTYSAELTAVTKEGTVLLTRTTAFVKKDPAREFSWWNTKRGNADKVLAPWTPVTLTNGSFGVWGRTFTLGDAGLPSHLTAQGRELLAQPMRLVAQRPDGSTGSAHEVGRRTLSSQPYRTVVEITSRLGTITVRSLVTVEYDGMIRIEMQLSPDQATTRIRSLRLVAPLRTEVSDYLHACGEGIRYGFDFRFLPRRKAGRLWDSRSVDGQPMQIGSFLPYLWVGDSKGGLCWFADSDAGWNPTSTVPAIEVRRDSPAHTDLVLNLIGAPTTLTHSRRIVFAFQATPVKPIMPGWRMDTWTTGDTFKDWAQIESKGKAGNMGLIFSSLPFPLDPAISRQMVVARHREPAATLGAADPKRYRANAVPYFEHINMGERFAPEMPYFSEEWRTRVSRGLSYGKTLTDFMIDHISRWTEQTGIDGFYLDNVFPIADDNLEAGRGYRLPDGRIQPTYQMFDTRRYMLRLRAALAEQGKQDKFVLHITNHMIAPWIGPADMALDGEHHVIYPEMNKDFMDFWSLERLRVDAPSSWGVAVNFLQEYQGKWPQERLKKAMRAYTGMLLLNDVLASANANGQNPETWQGRERFGMDDPDVQFLPYWDSQSGLQSRTPQVFVSGWRKARSGDHVEKVLLAVVNTGEKRVASVTVDLSRFAPGNPADWKAFDAETQEAIPISASGQLRMPVERHDYRQILLSAPPG